MKHLIFTIFVLIPLMEIAIFIEFSDAFGIWTIVTLILVSALIGGKLFQSQGLHTLQNAVASTEKNLFPAQEVFAGACIFLASLLLITPGVLTDLLGLALFSPPFRRYLGSKILQFFRGRFDFRGYTDVKNNTKDKYQSGQTIETNYREVIEEDPPHNT